MDAVLADMAATRVDALRRKAAEDIGLRILRHNGSVTADEIAAALEREWAPPSPRQLSDQIAAKCVAAIEFERTQVEAERGRLDLAREKAAKVKATASSMVLSAVAELEAAEDGEDLAVAEQRLRDAEALAKYAKRLGNPALAEPSRSKAVAAGVAKGAN